MRGGGLHVTVPAFAAERRLLLGVETDGENDNCTSRLRSKELAAIWMEGWMHR